MFVLNNDYQCFIVILKNKLKKGLQKACLNEKRCYFCTRNNADVLLYIGRLLRYSGLDF